jgi:cation:H+ antiporter
MFFNIFIFLIGLFLLYLGAELLIRGSSRLAHMAHIRPLVIGVTVIAFGTSSPEILVSFVAALSGEMDVALGNIVGSNIANIGLILGLSCIFRPLKLSENLGMKEIVWMLMATIIFWIFSLDGNLSRFEGMILFSGIIFFVLYLISTVIKDRNTAVKHTDIPEETERIKKYSKKFRLFYYSIQIILGMVTLVAGSKVTINTAVYIAHKIGVSEAIIGLSLVAFGTSLPELATAIIAIIKKEKEIFLGNIVGSNLFNLLFVGGAIAICFRVGMDLRIVHFDIPAMLIISIIPGILVLVIKRISRFLGMFLLLYYIIYIIYIYSWK